MDLSEATKILLDRIQQLEPEIATKIMGCILIQDLGELEMIRLACAPKTLLENLIHKTKLQLGYLPKPSISTSLSPSISINPPQISEAPMKNYMPFSPNRAPGAPYWDPQLSPEQKSVLSTDYTPLSFADSGVEDFAPQNHAQLFGFEERFDPVINGDVINGNLSVRISRRSPGLPEFSMRTCHYFNKGFCKHGSSCRYLHGPDNFAFYGTNDLGNEDHLFSPGSLETLEIEISELLKSRKGNPISIASVPILYYEKYGKTLQAQGYLTESQRHGRAGYSLTKLLARLNTIRLIDRPHGQHFLILAEDASKYNVDNRYERNDPGPIVSGSRQIYLTFPAESTFTEEDVANYFSTYGPVEDVRIPCQQKRMFGFVTFGGPGTVRIVLAKGNPHFVCGSRVLVKPYREKSKLVERKYGDKNDHGMSYPGYYLDLEPDFRPFRRCDPPRVLRRQLEEQEAQALEIRRRLSELHLGLKPIHNPQYFDYGVEELHASEDPSKLSAEGFNYLLGFISNNSVNDDTSKHSGPTFSDQDSQGIKLPESPFAATVGNSISAVM